MKSWSPRSRRITPFTRIFGAFCLKKPFDFSFENVEDLTSFSLMRLGRMVIFPEGERIRCFGVLILRPSRELSQGPQPLPFEHSFDFMDRRKFILDFLWTLVIAPRAKGLLVVSLEHRFVSINKDNLFNFCFGDFDFIIDFCLFLFAVIFIFFEPSLVKF